MSLRCTTLVDLLRQRAAAQATFRAYTFLDERGAEIAHLTFADLDLRARAIGAALQQRGITDQRVPLLFPPGLDFITAFFGCLYAGSVPVMVHPPHRKQATTRLGALLADAKASFALATEGIADRMRSLFAASHDAGSVTWLALESIHSDMAHQWSDPKPVGNDVAFVQYTSGSTSEPKGVMVSHGNILHNERMIQRAFGHDEHTVVVGWLPPYHDMGLIGNVLQPLYLGCQCILMSPASFLQRPLRWLEAISRYRATTSGAPDFAYELCVRKVGDQQRQHLDLSSWTVAYNGSEPVRLETMERFSRAFGRCGFRAEAFYPCYGLAEATLFVSGGKIGDGPVAYAANADKLAANLVTACEPGDVTARWLVECGHGWEGERIIIVDPGSLTRCPDGAIGEVWISGANVAQGYWQRPEESEAVFRARLRDSGEGPFLRTGDLGFMRDEKLFLTARLKDLLIIRGRNYYPQDIELAAQRSHPALRLNCGAAFTVDVEGDPRLVVAYEVERAVDAGDVAEIGPCIRQAVAAEHDLHVAIVLLLRAASIPRTTSGKVRRSACKAGFLQGTLNLVVADDPSSLAVRARTGGLRRTCANVKD